MHVPAKWKMTDIEHIHNFLENFGFATLVSADLESSVVPLLLARSEGEYGVLYGHLARSNSHAKTIDNSDVLAIFSGPHSYISPTWYAQQPAVPTWNYAAVHIKGKLSFTSEEQTLAILDRTVAKYEPKLLQDYQVMPKAYVQKLNQGIVGFKIEITQLQGKEKLGQHRNIDDQKGVVQGLKKSQTTDAKQLLEYMEKVQIGLGQ